MFIRSHHDAQQATFGSGFEKKVLLKKIGEMEDLPALDVNMTHIINLLMDQDISIKTLVEAIERDQSLVAKILKIINSAHYGLRKEVDSVERAVLLLGIIRLKQVIYSASTMDFYSSAHIVEWNHAYTASFLMNWLMQENDIPAVSNLPLSMLMHDIGKVVLRRYSAKRFETALERAISDNIPVFQAEEIAIGIDHTDVGGMLLEKWGMHPDIFMAAKLHHSNEIPPEYTNEIAMVQFVNWVDCRARSIMCFPPSEELIRAANLDKLDVDELTQKHREFIEESERPETPSH